MKKNLQNQRGFTLIETLLGVFVFSLIMVVLGLFARNIWIYSAFISGGIADVDAGRQAMATMSAEIRTANTADTGAYVIDTATSSTFTFYSDIDGDGLKEKVRYFVSGGVLKKGVIKPSGSPLTYNAANEKIYSMIPYLNNTSVFSYYDKDYDGTTAPLSSPVDIPSIRLVKITVTVDHSDPNRPPVPVTFSTQVSMRNLKDNL